MRRTDVAVVGAGPAGVAAALAAARAGARVTLVDEYPRPGGQIYRQPPSQFHLLRPEALGGDHTRAEEMLRALESSPVETLTDTLAWGARGRDTLLLYREGDGTETLQAGAVVVAAGAYDRPVAFPGWTLPGVWTVGGAQAMVKSQRILPGRRVLVAGAGPLLLPLAVALAEAGATVVAMVEATTRLDWARHAHRMWGHWSRVRDAAAYESALLAARVPRYFGYLLVRAEGSERVERATLAAVDADWRPVRGTEVSFDVDLVCAGYGFLASTELPSLLGCRMGFDPRHGQYLPLHDRNMETTVPGVYVAGETAGVGGAELAMAEGELAGLAAARAAGVSLGPDLRRRMEAAQARRRHLQGFADLLADLFTMRPGIYELADDDTPICRCEEVTAGEVRHAIRMGAGSVKALKGWTRVGMGPCQGRMCASLLAHLVARETGQPLQAVAGFTPRPPIKPVPLEALAQLLPEVEDAPV